MGRLPGISMLPSVDAFVGVISSSVAVLAAVIVGYGAILAFYQVMKSALHRTGTQNYERARIELGRMLVVALEFELGSDLLQTAVSPTWSHIGIVAAIVVLRSALNYLLEKDITRMERQIAREQAGQPAAESEA
jgi:uncharacterized membrane protein